MVAAINIGEALQYQKGGSPLRNLVQMSPARTNLAPDLADGARAGLRHRDVVAARHGRPQGPSRRTCASAW
jgi:hypothetical protein